MNGRKVKHYGYLVEIIKAIAWPLTVIWVGYLFRSHLQIFIDRISTLKYNNVEANFGKDLNVAESTAKSIPFPVKDKTDEELTKKEFLLRIAETSPRAAIVET